MRSLGRALSVPLCAVLLTGGAVVGQRHFRPTGPDAFLGFQVDSTDELVAVLKTNPALRKRYARHFGVSEAEVIDFVKRALVPHSLPEARSVTVYGVTKSGRIYAVKQRMRKGTKVWATRSGVPVLKWACANPMTRVLPGVRMASAPRVAREKSPGRVAMLPPVYEQVAPSVEEFIAPPDVPPGVFPAGGGLGGGGVAALLPAPGVLPGVIPGGVAVPVSVSPGGGGGFNPLAFLPLALLTGGGGSSDNGPPPSPPVTPPIVPPVTPSAEIPEPGTFSLLALGIPSLIAAGYRRRRGASC